MLYLVQARAAMERANTIDAGEGPGAVVAKIVEQIPSRSHYGKYVND